MFHICLCYTSSSPSNQLLLAYIRTVCICATATAAKESSNHVCNYLSWTIWNQQNKFNTRSHLLTHNHSVIHRLQWNCHVKSLVKTRDVKTEFTWIDNNVEYLFAMQTKGRRGDRMFSLSKQMRVRAHTHRIYTYVHFCISGEHHHHQQQWQLRQQ